MLPPCEASQPTFAPLVVEGALEERQVPAIKLEIAVGDVVLRTDMAISDARLQRREHRGLLAHRAVLLANGHMITVSAPDVARNLPPALQDIDLTRPG